MIKSVKVHLDPKKVFAKSNLFVIQAFGRKNFLIWLNPRFSVTFQSRASSVGGPSFRESGAVAADDVYPGTKHNGASVGQFSIKMEIKTNRSNIFWD